MKALRRSHTSSSSSSNSSSPSSSSSSSYWIHLRSVLFVVAASSPASCSSDRGHLKSPWSRRKRKQALSAHEWRSLFTPDGKLCDGGVKFLRKVRRGGVDPNIRPEVWPILLGVYDLNSSKQEREVSRNQKRKEYEMLRRQGQELLECSGDNLKLKETGGSSSNCNIENFDPGIDSPDSEDVVSARESLSSEERSPCIDYSDNLSCALLERDTDSRRTTDPNSPAFQTESSDSDSSEDPEVSSSFPFPGTREDSSPTEGEVQSRTCTSEDFTTWQRIIRLDAIRASGEWMAYSPAQATVSDERARRSAEVVRLKDYEHLEPWRIFHAARLVAILEAYAIYDPEIGYCQGMSDLLSPIITILPEDHEAFWCFVGFMRKARHNFRLDEVGIRRQLSIVSKIIKRKDSHLYRHLEKLQAEDCFFVYRMVVVLFRRELTFEQTICLWEVMWADQAAIRAGFGKSAWSRIRQRAPPTDDLLLYAIAASVLQRRKQIIEKYSSMDDIVRECNSMAGHLDVWKLLDDAHDLVVNLHDKI